ncbi:protein kinase domain containing protein [Stylonychia lemnae]|uniref:Protein kinase domain containing protein n=1 Tax=Stylonychia lemnae TaxID=5949 RepID=A0A077ZUT6_STYLE|nr:protein kinase domain containing protein [Stylonychia lemnae]|eukprot:CDW72221.1 protein kinase domain containing protein [Stylonychia lemnae]
MIIQKSDQKNQVRHLEREPLARLSKVAVKILEKDKIKDKKDVERITREIKILKKVRHPCVIQLYEIIETDKELFMVMEYSSGGELFEYIVQHQRLSEKQACKFYQELISGIEYLHKSGVCHRDLKPENLLLDFDKTLKIVDFGLSNLYERAETLKTACGSPCYAAPEMIAGKRYNGLQTDIWSSGVVLFAMVCGYLPFEDPKTSNLYKKILNADYQIPKFVSNDGRDLITKILNTDPEERFTIADIRAHPWFKQIQRVDKDNVGLFPGLKKMPIDDNLLEQILVEYGFEKDYSVKCLEANRHNHITATYHLIQKRNKRTQALRETIAPILNQSSATSTNLVDLKQQLRTSQQQHQKKPITNLNQTMPIATNPKINNMIDNSMAADSIPKHQRDMSVEDAPHSRLSELNRNNQVQVAPSNLTNGTNERQEIIASRINSNTSKSPDKYMIGNSLVVTLNDSNVTNNSYVQQNSQKKSFQNQFRATSKNQQSIFPSTTTATTANSYSDQRKSENSQQRKGNNYEPLIQGPPSLHQRFKSMNQAPQTTSIQQQQQLQQQSIQQNQNSSLYQAQNPLKLNLPLRYLKNNPQVLVGTKKQQLGNQTVNNWQQLDMNKTTTFNFQTIGTSKNNQRTATIQQNGQTDGSFQGSKKIRIPPQLFQGATKMNQTVTYAQENSTIMPNSKRGKTSSRDTSPENRRSDQYTIQGRGITPNNEYQTNANGSLNNKIFRQNYKNSTAPSNPYTSNQPFTPVGMVTPLPEANNRTNTALGYKQTNPNGGIMNNSMIVSTQMGELQAAQIIGRSRHSDRRESNSQQNQPSVGNQKRPQLNIDYQSIFNSAHHRGGSSVNGANNLNITELYGHYQSTKANKNQNQMATGQLFIPQSMKMDAQQKKQADNQQVRSQSVTVQ